MRIPRSASEPIDNKDQEPQEKNIINNYFDKRLLTPAEAIDCINQLSGILLAYGYTRSQSEDKKYLQTP